MFVDYFNALNFVWLITFTVAFIIWAVDHYLIFRQETIHTKIKKMFFLRSKPTVETNEGRQEFIDRGYTDEETMP